MDVNRAEKIVLRKYPKEQLVSVVDWDKYYVFNTIPKQGDAERNKRLIKSLRAVIKDTGKVMTFNPLYHGDKSYFESVKNSIKYY